MLNGKQKRYLRKLAEKQPALFQIGKQALSDPFIEMIDKALAKRELIKIRVLKNAPEDREELAFDLAMNTQSEVVQIIGNMIVLYRMGDDPKIVLP